MSYFLWIEDFDNSTKTTANDVLGGIDIFKDGSYFAEEKRQLRQKLKPQGVLIELSFQDGLNFIRKQLHKIDYVILDINLPAYSDGDSINDEVLKLLTDFQAYREQADEDGQLLAEECKKLREIAGFYLYTELVFESGFPKNHILFCSQHGEEMGSIKEAFKTAKIDSPDIYKKADTYVQNWVKEKYENPYSRLRRGIIEGCNHLKTLTENELRFNNFIKEDDKKISFLDLADYVGVLENFLPLQEPKNKTRFFKLFVRTLAHEWEAAEPDNIRKQKTQDKKQQDVLFAFSRIMKTSRNWLAHSKIFEQLTAQDVAYLFIINMRAMFDLGNELLPYEKHLLSLFDDVISECEFKNVIGDDKKNRKIPLVENYAQLLKKTGNTWQAVNFHDALNNLQKNKESALEASEFIKGLYQMFWFMTSSGQVDIPSDDKEIKNLFLKYQFRYFDYHKNKPDYLFELARHIYNRSFS